MVRIEEEGGTLKKKDGVRGGALPTGSGWSIKKVKSLMQTKEGALLCGANPPYA